MLDGLLGPTRDSQRFEILTEILKILLKRKIEKPTTLYNLSVEDDESYIANGIVVHNCRCTLVPIIKDGII